MQILKLQARFYYDLMNYNYRIVVDPEVNRHTTKLVFINSKMKTDQMAA